LPSGLFEPELTSETTNPCRQFSRVP